MRVAFIDANVILRHLLGDHDEHSPRASVFLATVERGDERVYVSALVVSEIVFTLTRHYKRSKREVRDALVSILLLPGVSVDDEEHLLRAFDLYVDENLPFVDAYLASKMLAEGADGIVSFDKDFERVPGVRRIEP